MTSASVERKVGVILSYFQLIIGFVIGFAITPIILKKLGDSEYGVYTLVASLCAYLNVVEQGLADTVVKYIIKFKLDETPDRVEHFSAVILIINGVLSGLILLAGSILYYAMPDIYSKSLTVTEITIAQRLLILMVINLIVSFMFNLYQGILIASEKFILLRVTGLGNTVVTYGLSVALLYLGGRSFSIVAITLSCNVIVSLFNFLYCKIKLQQKSKLHKGALTKTVYFELLKYFMAIFIVVIVEQIYWKLDNLIISFMLGATFITIYSIGMSFHKYLMKFSTTISKVLAPKVFKFVLSGQSSQQVTDELIKIARVQAFGVYLALCGLIVYGLDFIRLWVGLEYREAYPIILLTLIPYSFEIVGNLRNTILQAHDLYLKKSLIQLFISVLNIILTIIFIRIWGIVGAALGTGIGVFVGQFGINWLLIKNGCCDLKRYYYNVYAKLSLIIAVMVAAGLITKPLLSIRNWAEFFTIAAIYSLIYFVLLWVIVLEPDERNAIAHSFRRIVHRG